MFAQAITFAVLAGAALAQTFSINTPPSIQQCQTAALSWVGGTAPFVLAAIPAGQVSAAALATIAQNVNGQSTSWNVNLAQGTAITIRITDAQGNIAYSSSLNVQAGTSSACLTAGSSSSGSGSASSAAASATGVVGGAASSASSAVGSASSAVASISSSAASVVSSASSNAASMTSGAASSSGASNTNTSSRPAASTAAASSSAAAAFSQASFNVPFLALAAALGCAAFGGFTLLA